MQGLVPIGYTLFAVALGIFAGTIWHKVLPAMAVTLAGFLGLRLALTILARPRYLPAGTLTYPMQGATDQPNPTARRLGPRQRHPRRLRQHRRGGRLDSSARPTRRDREPAAAPGSASDPARYNWQLYQPADRFWLFQGIETGIFVALAALLLYLAIRRIRRIA